MFSLGGTELLLIAVVALLLFGPDKLPQIARTVGRFMREFNKYRDIMESTLRTEIYAAEAKTSEAPSRESEMDELRKSAEAAREFAATHGAADQGDAVAVTCPEPDAELAPVPAPESSAGSARTSAISTDEDEEEGA